ncbi:glycosyl transferase [Cnuibacter physcomitrellae]|nr:glycosyl transferase [Cnuibacter physcomitrellae]
MALMGSKHNGAVQPGSVAVITAYRPDGDSLASLVAALRPQVEAVVVVDDGSGATAPFDDAAEAGAIVVTHDENRGIAAALNTGIRTARAHVDARWVLTFDQDSTVAPDYVASLVATAQAATAAGIRVGLVAPRRVEGLPALEAGVRDGFVLGSEPIQSGLLIPVAVLEAVGPFAEALFIDCVDTDLWLRVRDHGFEVVLDPLAELGHALGRRHVVRALGRELHVTHAATFRYYYLARNRILMNRMHGRGRRAWALQQTAADLRHFVIALVLVPDRGRRLRMIVAGIRDGWRGRTGRMPVEVERVATAA